MAFMTEAKTQIQFVMDNGYSNNGVDLDSRDTRGSYDGNQTVVDMDYT